MFRLPKLCKQLFSKMNKQELKKRLTPMQYRVTQESGTQPPFQNEYHNCKTPGNYNCVVCGTKLFTSQNKFDSGCGWPAFYDKAQGANIRELKDSTHGMVRTQVRCGDCDSHLGHVFQDGPKDKTGIRYCINSASIDLKPTK